MQETLEKVETSNQVLYQDLEKIGNNLQTKIDQSQEQLREVIETTIQEENLINEGYEVSDEEDAEAEYYWNYQVWQEMAEQDFQMDSDRPPDNPYWHNNQHQLERLMTEAQ